MNSRFSLFLLIAVSPLHGQSGQNDPLPGAPAHEDPVALEDFVVSATPFIRAQTEIAQPTSVVAGQRLAVQLQPTLGETLSQEAGIASTYFGPAASRPVIRGLGGDRIRVLNGGIGTMDASVISPDHAVTIDPALIKRIEIVRGPATLLYGGSAVGGVVNVIDERIPGELPDAKLSGWSEARLGSAANERAFVGHLRGAANSVGWQLSGFSRDLDDVEIPGGDLLNSRAKTQGGSGGIAYHATHGHLGVAFSEFGSNYGVVIAPEVTIEMRQQRWELQGEWNRPGRFWHAAKVQAGLGRYRHQELEGAEIGTRLRNDGTEARFELHHERRAGWEGAVGLQLNDADFLATGDEAFLPSSRTRQAALFVYEELARGAFTFQLGARVEEQRLTAALDSGAFARRDHAFSAAGGIIWRFADDWSLALSTTASERAPNTQELLANGPHIGTGVFEIGDPQLGVEQSRGLDLSLRRRAGHWTGSLTFFANRFNGYITDAATGAVDPDDNLPVFAYTARAASFYGAEVEAILHLHESKTHQADFRITADSVRGRERGAADLPRMTPARLGVAFDYRHAAFSVTAEFRAVARQTRVAPLETATDGYQLLSAYACWHHHGPRVDAEFFVRITNATDELARAHTSVIKEIAPLPGRDLSVGVRVKF